MAAWGLVLVWMELVLELEFLPRFDRNQGHMCQWTPPGACCIPAAELQWQPRSRAQQPEDLPLQLRLELSG